MSYNVCLVSLQLLICVLLILPAIIEFEALDDLVLRHVEQLVVSNEVGHIDCVNIQIFWEF